MLIDTSTGMVTLEANEHLMLKDLDALTSVYVRGGWRVVVLPEPEPDPEDDLAVTVLGSRVVSSAAGFGVTYTIIRLENGDYVCSCPDFQHRHAAQGGSCKHIWRVSYYDPIQ